MKNLRLLGEGQKAKGKVEPFEVKNAVLYATGKKYAAQLDKKSVTVKAYTAEIRAIAAKVGVETKEVRRAVEFAKTVDQLEANCGSEANKQILTDNPRLSAEVVMQIGRTHPDRQRFALAQAKVDRDPFGKPPAGIEPPFDTLGYCEVLSRLARNAGLLDHVADGLLGTPAGGWPGDDSMQDFAANLADIIKACRRMTVMAKKFGGRHKEGGAAPHRKPRGATSSFVPLSTFGKVASVLGIASKNVRDLPRLIRETPPTRAEADAVLEGLANLRRSAQRLAAVVGARGRSTVEGPLAVPGTYVVFYRLAEDAPSLKVGALGTFDFPAGIYAYLGSAFGGGGVRKRTNRHLTRHSPRKWNVDWLKPLCTAVAVWWTHDRDKVEFDWASALAGLPGAEFPVPGFGASDNPKADAHLARFDHMPSSNAFRRSVAKAMKGHAPVYEKVVKDWKGAGWPE